METRAQARQAEINKQYSYFPNPKYDANFFKNYAENMQKEIDEQNNKYGEHAKIIYDTDGQIKLKSEAGQDITKQPQANISVEDMANTGLTFSESSDVLQRYSDLKGTAMFNMLKVICSMMFMGNNAPAIGYVKNKLLQDCHTEFIDNLGRMLLETNVETCIAYTNNPDYQKAYQTIITGVWEVDCKLMSDPMMIATLDAEIEKQKMRQEEDNTDADVDMMDDVADSSKKLKTT
jgi:hypothetical protein